MTRSFLTLTRPDQDLAIAEIDVLHAQAQGFHLAHAGTVEEPDNQPVDSRDRSKQVANLAAGEDYRQVPRALCPNDIVQPVEFSAQYLLVHEQDGGERLVLGGCGNLAFNGQPGQKSRDFVFTHFMRVSLVMKTDKAPDPLNVTLFGPETVMPGTNFHAHTIE